MVGAGGVKKCRVVHRRSSFRQKNDKILLCDCDVEHKYLFIDSIRRLASVYAVIALGFVYLVLK